MLTFQSIPHPFVIKKFSALTPLLMKFFTKPAPRRPLRFTLLDLHTTGVIQVFRTHSFFRLWTPLRENFDAEQDFAN